MKTSSTKAREYRASEARSELRTNLRLALVFGVLCGLSYWIFQLKPVAALLALPLAVFTLKVGFYGFVVIRTRYSDPVAAGEGLFDRRVAEIGEGEFIEETDSLGPSLRVIRDDKTDIACLRRVLGPTDVFLASFRAFKAECRAEHPELAEEVSAMEIVGIELETEGSIFVYFSGVPGGLFLARYDGQQWYRL